MILSFFSLIFKTLKLCPVKNKWVCFIFLSFDKLVQWFSIFQSWICIPLFLWSSASFLDKLEKSICRVLESSWELTNFYASSCSLACLAVKLVTNYCSFYVLLPEWYLTAPSTLLKLCGIIDFELFSPFTMPNTWSDPPYQFQNWLRIICVSFKFPSCYVSSTIFPYCYRDLNKNEENIEKYPKKYPIRLGGMSDSESE